MKPGLLARAGNLLGRITRRSSSALGSGYVAAAPVLSGAYVTPQTAIGLTAVFAAINVLSGDVATLPLHVYAKLPNGGKRIADDFYLEDLLTTAWNDEIDAFRHRRDSMGHVLGWGNGYNEIVRDRKTGNVEEIHLLHPAKTKPKRAQGSNRLYYALENDDDRRVLPENMLHFAGLGFNGLEGYSPITVARQSIGLAMAAEQFGAALFGNGAIPKGVLKTAKKMPQAGSANLRNTINQVHQGAQSAHQLMILWDGMDWVNTQINPDDAQFLATRQFQTVEIARLFGLPPSKIGDYSESHRANVEEANLDYITTTLCRLVVMIEAQLNWKLLTRADRQKYVILHDFTNLMRGNMTARGDFYVKMRNMGCMSADDILRAEGRNPIGPAKGGDKYLVQMQYQPLEKAGESPPKPAPAPAPAPAEAKDQTESDATTTTDMKGKS